MDAQSQLWPSMTVVSLAYIKFSSLILDLLCELTDFSFARPISLDIKPAERSEEVAEHRAALSNSVELTLLVDIIIVPGSVVAGLAGVRADGSEPVNTFLTALLEVRAKSLLSELEAGGLVDPEVSGRGAILGLVLEGVVVEDVRGEEIDGANTSNGGVAAFFEVLRDLAGVRIHEVSEVVDRTREVVHACLPAVPGVAILDDAGCAKLHVGSVTLDHAIGIIDEVGGHRLEELLLVGKADGGGQTDESGFIHYKFIR